MNKKFLLSFVCYCSLIFASPIQERIIDVDALTHLTSALDIPKDADVVAATQKHWLRKPNQERWEMAEISAEKRLFVLNWATNEGLLCDWKPSLITYDKALILGTTTFGMQSRLNYLKKLWVEGTRFEEIVWLTGDRPLNENVDAMLDRCNNESEAARIIWEEANLPKEMRALQVTFIAVPMKSEGSKLKRPNTEDTIIAWLNEHPKPCKAVFVSDQPFCGYQYAVVKSCLPDNYLFDVVGPAPKSTDHPAAAAIILDSIARWIYQENQIVKAQAP